MVTSTPPNLGKFPGIPVVEYACGGIATPPTNPHPKVTTYSASTNEAGESGHVESDVPF